MSVTSQAIPQPTSSFLIWWKTIRPATLWAGAAPVLVGSALAYRHQKFEWLPSIVALLGALFIQIACNLVNDYSDFEKGADHAGRLGPARAAAQGWQEGSRRPAHARFVRDGGNPGDPRRQPHLLLPHAHRMGRAHRPRDREREEFRDAVRARRQEMRPEGMPASKQSR